MRNANLLKIHVSEIIIKQIRINTQYMTNSTLVSPVKMEYGWNFSISGLKIMMKSGLGKIFLKFLYALTMLFLLPNLYFWSKFSNKNDYVSAWRKFKNIFLCVNIHQPGFHLSQNWEDSHFEALNESKF